MNPRIGKGVVSLDRPKRSRPMPVVRKVIITKSVTIEVSDFSFPEDLVDEAKKIMKEVQL